LRRLVATPTHNHPLARSRSACASNFPRPRFSYVRTLRALVSLKLDLDPPRSWFQIGLFPPELDPSPFTHAWHPPRNPAWPKQSQHNIDPDRNLCPASPLVAFSIQLDSHSFSNLNLSGASRHSFSPFSSPRTRIAPRCASLTTSSASLCPFRIAQPSKFTYKVDPFPLRSPLSPFSLLQPSPQAFLSVRAHTISLSSLICDPLRIWMTWSDSW